MAEKDSIKVANRVVQDVLLDQAQNDIRDTMKDSVRANPEKTDSGSLSKRATKKAIRDNLRVVE